MEQCCSYNSKEGTNDISHQAALLRAYAGSTTTSNEILTGVSTPKSPPPIRRLETLSKDSVIWGHRNILAK